MSIDHINTHNPNNRAWEVNCGIASWSDLPSAFVLECVCDLQHKAQSLSSMANGMSRYTPLFC